jgi:ankyrin repeat protein
MIIGGLSRDKQDLEVNEFVQEYFKSIIASLSEEELINLKNILSKSFEDIAKPEWPEIAGLKDISPEAQAKFFDDFYIKYHQDAFNILYYDNVLKKEIYQKEFSDEARATFYNSHFMKFYSRCNLGDMLDNALNNKLGEKIINAIKGSNIEYIENIKGMIDKGMIHKAIEFIDINGKSPLQFALSRREEEIANLLIDMCGNVNLTDKKGQTPLHVAIQYACDDSAELLIKKGAKINARNNEGMTPLHYAVNRDYDYMVGVLINNAADVNIVDDLKNTPLHIALKSIHYGNTKIDIVDLLLGANINVNIINNDGDSALHLAVSFSDIITKKLLDKGASLYLTNGSGMTALDVALHFGKINIAELLINKLPDVAGADKNDLKTLHTALNTVSKLGYKHLIEILINKGVEVSEADISLASYNVQEILKKAFETQQKNRILNACEEA